NPHHFRSRNAPGTSPSQRTLKPESPVQPSTDRTYRHAIHFALLARKQSPPCFPTPKVSALSIVAEPAVSRIALPKPQVFLSLCGRKTNPQNAGANRCRE